MSGKAYITNMAAFMPNAPVSNDAMESVLGMIGGRPSRARRTILRSNGVKTRHYVIDPDTGHVTHTNAQLTAAAVRRLRNQRFDLAQVDLLACGTTVADQLVPGHASMVHGELGIAPCETLTSAGVCISSTSAMKYAMLAVAAGECRHAVSTGSEVSSLILRAGNFQVDGNEQTDASSKNNALAFESDFLRWMLSDGAGAALIEAEPASQGLSLRLEWILERSYAAEQPACMYSGAEKLDDGSLRGWLFYAPEERNRRSLFTLGQDIKQLNAHITHYTVERPLRELARLKNLQPEQVDFFLPHYSSHYFRARLYEQLQQAEFPIPYERWFTNLYSRGNTGAASIYIMLEELFSSRRLRPGHRLLCYVPESGRFSTAWIYLTVCDQEG